jgi:short-subunit dehydrogenase
MSKLSGAALITGASTGIGAVYADRLARRGLDLVLVARDRGKLEILATRLRGETGQKIEVLAADLTDPADLAEVEDRLRQSDIAVLVNNAGAANLVALADLSREGLDTMVALNILALTRLTHAALPGLIERQGAVINIGSVVSVLYRPTNQVYAGTKAYVSAFSNSLAQEVEPQGVRVQAVLPGVIRTDLWNSPGGDISAFPDVAIMSAEDLVDAALAGFDLGETVTVPSLPDAADWQAFEATRAALAPNLSRNKPAARYGVA